MALHEDSTKGVVLTGAVAADLAALAMWRMVTSSRRRQALAIALMERELETLMDLQSKMKLTRNRNRGALVFIEEEDLGSSFDNFSFYRV